MSALSSSGGDRAAWRGGWVAARNAMMRAALDPAGVGGPLGEVISLFGDLFAAHLADPAGAPRECVSFSELFASMCRHRDIGAETADGCLFDRDVPQAGGIAEVDQTAALVLDDAIHCRLIVDWTARQFDPEAPVPLIVPLAQVGESPVLGERPGG